MHLLFLLAGIMADPFECAAWDDDEGVEKLNAELFHLQALPSQVFSVSIFAEKKGSCDHLRYV